MNQITETTGQQIVTATTGNKITLPMVFAAAKPTIEAIKMMWTPLQWCAQHHDRIGNVVGVDVLDTRKEACARNRDAARQWYDYIPDWPVLDQAEKLFTAAENTPAPADWMPMSFDAMLMAMPNAKNISEHTVAAYLETLDDPETWQGYGPGFSAAVVVRSIRETMRASTYVATPCELLQMLQKHRKLFRTWQSDVQWLRDARDRAEDILLNLGEIKFDMPDDDSLIPF